MAKPYALREPGELRLLEFNLLERNEASRFVVLRNKYLQTNQSFTVIT